MVSNTPKPLNVGRPVLVSPQVTKQNPPLGLQAIERGVHDTHEGVLMSPRIPKSRWARLPFRARSSVRLADLLGLPPIRWQMTPVTPRGRWSQA